MSDSLSICARRLFGWVSRRRNEQTRLPLLLSPTQRHVRQDDTEGIRTPRGQSPMEFERVSLATRTQCRSQGRGDHRRGAPTKGARTIGEKTGAQRTGGMALPRVRLFSLVGRSTRRREVVGSSATGGSFSTLRLGGKRKASRKRGPAQDSNRRSPAPEATGPLTRERRSTTGGEDTRNGGAVRRELRAGLQLRLGS
jgi:hypothetical protein